MVVILDRVGRVIGKRIRLPTFRLARPPPGVTWFALMLLVIVAGSAAAGSAAAYQPLDVVREAVEEFLTAQDYPSTSGLKIEVGHLDDRLRLHLCSIPLEVFFPPGGNRQGAITLGVSCNGSSPWSIYVPARVAVSGKVLVATRVLARGSTLASEDVRFEERDLAQLNGFYLSDFSQVVGKVSKRAIPVGSVILPSVLIEPRVVRRGDRVSLIVQGNGLEVRMEGEALKDGALGDVVRVRNLSSKRELEGVVAGAGLVRIRI